MPRPFRSTFTAVAIGAVILAGAMGFIGFKDRIWPGEEEQMVLKCEELMKDRLRSPSTYRRVAVSPLPRRSATYEEFMGWWNRELEDASKQLARRDPKYADLIARRGKLFDAADHDFVGINVEYDASNAYGTPLRGEFLCTIVSRHESSLDLSVIGPAVDGFTALTWPLHQMRVLQGLVAE